jgi:hypothetical protein
LPGLEAGAGPDESDEMGRVHGPPAVLRGLHELERDRQARGARSRAPGDLGTGAVQVIAPRVNDKRIERLGG